MCLQKKKETFRHVFLTNHKYIFKKSSKETTCFLQMNSLLLNMRTEMHWNKGLLFIRSNLQLTEKLVSDLPSGQAPSFHVAVENLINRILLWLDSQKKKNRLLIWWNLISFYYFCFTFLSIISVSLFFGFVYFQALPEFHLITVNLLGVFLHQKRHKT